MANVNYWLKEPTKKGETLIYLFFRFRGHTVKVSTGETIHPENWSLKLQKAKKNVLTTANGKHALNDFLSALSEQCELIYNSSLTNGIPSPELIKRGLREYMDKHNKTKGTGNANLFYDLVQKFVSGEILNKGAEKSAETLKRYKTIQNHLKEFEKSSRYPVNFDTINRTFFDKFNRYFIKEGISQNTRGKYIKVLKSFLNEGAERGLTNNLDYKKRYFSVTISETESIYLTEREILQFYNHDLSAKPRLERVRDLFVFGCFVGLRYSDFKRIKPDNIIKKGTDTFIKIITQKTNELVIVPTNPVITEILKKYNGNTPPGISNQRFNKYLKEAAELAKLIETGRLSTAPDKPLNDCISSHTARRSFATNLFLEGFPTFEIMKITGHKSERSFMKYVKVTKEQSAIRLNDHIKRNWSKKVLSLAS